MSRIEKIEIGIHFGILSNSISMQCLAQGFTLGDKANKIDRLAECINGLYFSGILTEKEKNVCDDRLFRMVQKYARPHRPEAKPPSEKLR